MKEMKDIKEMKEIAPAFFIKKWQRFQKKCAHDRFSDRKPIKYINLNILQKSAKILSQESRALQHFFLLFSSLSENSNLPLLDSFRIKQNAVGIHNSKVKCHKNLTGTEMLTRLWHHPYSMLMCSVFRYKCATRTFKMQDQSLKNFVGKSLIP